jgi:hypothetical protein
MAPRLTIQPDGSVSMCALQSTGMDAPDLATQVVGRVQRLNSGAERWSAGDDSFTRSTSCRRVEDDDLAS